MTLATTALLLMVIATMGFTGCSGQKHAVPPTARTAPEYRAFGNPERVTIRGYAGDAMEPFITKDGRYLLFNNRNDPRSNTNLHFAERVDDLTFYYRGEIKGVNTQALEGVPSVDRSGNLFFVSTRTYKESLSTLFRGRLDDGNVSGVQLVPGISRRFPGIVTFDAEITADGDTLFVVEPVHRRRGSRNRRHLYCDSRRRWISSPCDQWGCAEEREHRRTGVRARNFPGPARTVLHAHGPAWRVDQDRDLPSGTYKQRSTFRSTGKSLAHRRIRRGALTFERRTLTLLSHARRRTLRHSSCVEVTLSNQGQIPLRRPRSRQFVPRPQRGRSSTSAASI